MMLTDPIRSLILERHKQQELRQHFDNCQAQGQGQTSKRQTSKLDPEVGFVMGWPTHHHHHH